MSKVQIDWTQYFTYEQLSSILHELETAYPELVNLVSIGKTHRDRDIFLLELTNKATGAADTKPAMYVDANMHAEEFCGTSVAVYIAKQLLEGYGVTERETRLLDTSTFYIVPRLDPDGAEYSLTQDWPWCGNGRFLPGEEQPGPGFYFGDVDGDGLITQMRVVDPDGEWKISDKDPRLMVQRRPDEYGGTYYRLFPEGYVRDWDGVNIEMPKPRDGNLNRNYPSQFTGPHLQYGSGDYPTSEPETKAVVEWWLAHKNIAMALNYHTHGGVILRPFANRSDDHFHPDDLALYKTLGHMGTEVTGYPVISVYNDFTPVKSEPRGGTLTCWGFDEMGVPVLAIELWDVYAEAGIQDKDYYPLGPKSEDDMAKLLAWQDKHLDGDGFVEWHTVEHPQFGTVEVGGWKRIAIFRNPPGIMLEEMAKANAEYALRLAGTLPRLDVRNVTCEPFDGDTYKISAHVVSTGYLSTNVTQTALEVKRAEPVTATLELGEGAVIAHGNASIALGHLPGRAERRNEWSPWGNTWHSPGKKVEWLVRVKPGTTVTATVHAATPRAGVARQDVTVG